MTYQSDPTRWTHTSGDAPELLRDAFQAGSHEGPSNLQMRALALKLAAVGTGAALAAAATTAHASTTSAGGAAAGGAFAAKSAGALTLTKVAVSIALVGGAATGAVMMRRAEPQPIVQTSAQVEQVQVPRETAVPVETLGAPVASPLPSRAAEAIDNARAAVGAQPAREAQVRAVEPAPVPAQKADAVGAKGGIAATGTDSARDNVSARPAPSDAVQASAPVGGAARSHHATTRADGSRAGSEAAASQAEGHKSVSVARAEGGRAQLSEIELLRSARSALAARPKEAYRLTEAHKQQYPKGVFAQERDALAVEAVQRAGDLKLARKLAESFVKSYPSSPHAHRFRETMNLP